MRDPGPAVRVYLATSLDGYLAGPEDDLSWLPSDIDLGEAGFEPFLATIGALLMGRSTFDVVAGMDDASWPYGDRPVLVATHRPLVATGTKAARAEVVTGSIDEMIGRARSLAGSGDIYLDGGTLVRQALDAGLALDLTLTVIPVRLGGGVPLFGTGERRPLRLRAATPLAGGLVQLRYEVPAVRP